jgi:hypothetical protein
MAVDLTEKEFSKHVNTKFRATADGGTEADLQLVEVKGYASKHEEQQGMERFSVYFEGPLEPHLPQKIYTLQHDQMGDFEIFLVPLSRDERGFRYEAVFNYFKSSEVKSER